MRTPAYKFKPSLLKIEKGVKTYLDYLWESDYSKRTKLYYTRELKDLMKYEEKVYGN